MRISPLMGWTGGDSGNEVVLFSLPPGPDSLFLLVVLQRAFSAIAPLSNQHSPPPLCSLNRKICVLIDYGNSAQCPAFWFEFFHVIPGKHFKTPHKQTHAHSCDGCHHTKSDLRNISKNSRLLDQSSPSFQNWNQGASSFYPTSINKKSHFLQCSRLPKL